MSHGVPRPIPRWSNWLHEDVVNPEAVKLAGMTAWAGSGAAREPGSSAIVSVGPPLSANGPRKLSMVAESLTLGSDRPQVPSSSTL